MKKIITVTKDDKETNLVVKRPGRKLKLDAQVFSSRKMGELLKEKNILRRKDLTEHMLDMGWFTEDDVKDLEELAEKIEANEAQIKRGGVDADGNRVSKEEVRQLAVDTYIMRLTQMQLLSKRKSYDHLTLEGMVENAEFDFLISQSVYYTNGKPVFDDYEDYLDKAEEDYSFQAAETLSELMYGSLDDVYEATPEVKFLKKYDLINDENKFLNTEGQLVNANGDVLEDENTVEDDISFTEFED